MSAVRDTTEAKVLIVPRGSVGLVRMRLEVKEGGYQSYSATLRTPEGIEIWNQQLGPQPPHNISLRLPAKLLVSGDYILSLSGVTVSGEDVNAGKYYFRVETKY